MSTREGAKMKKDLAKRQATLIAEELMRNNIGERASRLQLRGPNEEDLGGYCREIVEKIIRDVIERDLSPDVANTKGRRVSGEA